MGPPSHQQAGGAMSPWLGSGGRVWKPQICSLSVIYLNITIELYFIALIKPFIAITPPTLIAKSAAGIITTSFNPFVVVIVFIKRYLLTIYKIKRTKGYLNNISLVRIIIS